MKAALALAALVVVAGGGRAMAHPPPEGTELVWIPDGTAGSPSGPAERLFIRTQRGFVVESPATRDFRFLCNAFLGVQDGENASLALWEGDTLLLTTYVRGVLMGSSDACTWSAVAAVSSAPAFDVAIAKTGGEEVAYVVGGPPHAGEHFWAGRNRGTTWTPLANTDQPYTRVRIAAGDHRRVYMTGIDLTATGAVIHRLGVSDDAGRTVVDRLITLGANDLQARVLDVDPVEQDRVYVHVESNSNELADRLMVTDDAGQTFKNAMTMHAIGGLAQSEDGIRVWVGGKEGIYRSMDHGESFAPVASAITTVTCLALHGGRLYACGFLDNQLMVAVSDDDGDSFSKVVSFDQIRQTVDCSGSDAVHTPSTVCADDMDDWRSELGALPASLDGGTPIIGSDGSPGAAAGKGDQPVGGQRAGSSCAVASHHDKNGPGSATQLLVLAAPLVWRRIRRQTSIQRSSIRCSG